MASIFSIETGRGNKILRTISTDVKKIDAHVKKIIVKMIKTVKKDKNACGLAAPQIGKNIRIVICLLGKKLIPLINPVILSHSENTNFDDEGCLSIPGEYGKVERWNEIEIEYLDEKEMKQKRKLSNFDARVVLHEIDHLDGILFIDRMTETHLQEMNSEKMKNL